MKPTTIPRVLLLSVFLTSVGLSFCHAVPAFPTAEGFGANAVGGRGGRVIEVTNLNDAGPGSLRACAESTGPRTCVFRVGGTIVLNGLINVWAANSNLTIAGQTAPGGGIQLKNFGLHIAYGAHDVIIRYLKIREGTDAVPQNINDCGGLTVYGPGSDTASPLTYNIIVDHVSIEWVCDDSFQFYGSKVRDTTLQWSLIGEGLTENDYRNAEGGGAASKGTILGGSGDTWSLHHNLYIHMDARNPMAQGGAKGTPPPLLDFRNNIGYNWRTCYGNMQLGGYNGDDIPGNDSSINANYVGNKSIPGPNSSLGCVLGLLGGNQTRIYLENNWSPFCKNGCSSLTDMGFLDLIDYPILATPASDAKFRTYTPFQTPPITLTPLTALEGVLAAKAGAIIPVRDSLDARLIQEFVTRTGDRGRNGAPWPVLASGTPPTDSDHDGMPDSWESAHGLNPNNVADGAQVAASGYTYLENYLNELAGDTVTTSPPPGVPAGLSLNLPLYISENSQIRADYGGSPAPANFDWTFTYTGPATSKHAAPSATSGAPNATLKTRSPVASLSALAQNFGVYQVTVQALDENNVPMGSAQASFTLVPASLSNVRAFPNPWRKDRHSTRQVTFDGLTVNSTIKIFTASGHWVKTLPTSSTSVLWDLTNNSGDTVASGNYVYVITTDAGDKKTGQLVVIK